jgi:putative PIN family toxin of toxin-antitoxin system
MAFALGYGHIFVSAVVVMEYRRVLTGPKLSRLLSRRRAEQIIDEILREAVLLDPEISIRECRDPSDDAYLELATAAAAHVIISSDHDLLVLDPWRGVRIVTPAQFLTLAAAGT